jgi:hypothetical protein
VPALVDVFLTNVSNDPNEPSPASETIPRNASPAQLFGERDWRFCMVGAGDDGEKHDLFFFFLLVLLCELG